MKAPEHAVARLFVLATMGCTGWLVAVGRPDGLAGASMVIVDAAAVVGASIVLVYTGLRNGLLSCDGSSTRLALLVGLVSVLALLARLFVLF